jgi:hypothetical protein
MIKSSSKWNLLCVVAAVFMAALLTTACGGGEEPLPVGGGGGGARVGDSGGGVIPSRSSGSGDTGRGDTGVGGLGTAHACFNPVLYQADTTYTTTERTTDSYGVSVTSSMSIVTGPDFYNGHPVVRTMATINNRLQAEFFTEIRDGWREVFHYTTLIEGGDVTEIFPFPPSFFRYDLEVGESYGQSYFLDSLHNGVSGTSPPVLQTAFDQVTTYVGRETIMITYAGRETITIEAGTFEACRFDGVTIPTMLMQEPLPNSQDTYASQIWVGVGNGLKLKRIKTEALGFTEVTELLSASINNEPVTGIETEPL